MADQRIRVVISGDSRGLEQAADRSGRSIRRLGNDIGTQNAKVSLLTRGAQGLGDTFGGLTKATIASQAVTAFGGAAIGATAAVAPLAASVAALPGLLGAAGQGFGVISLATTDLAKAYNGVEKSLNRLTPEAKSFLRTLKSYKPEITELRRTAQQGLFPGVEAGLKAAHANFGPLKGIVKGTAEALGELAEEAGENFGSRGWGRDLETMGARNVTTIERLGRSGGHLVDALRHVTIAAGPFTAWMTGAVERMSRLTAAKAKAGRESGAMARGLNEARVALQRVGSIGGSTVGTLYDVGRAAKSAVGDSLLRSLDRGAESMRKWTRSTEGQRQMRQFFRDTGPLVRSLASNFGQVARTLGRWTAATTHFLAKHPQLREVLTTMVAIGVAAKLTGAATAVKGLAKAYLALSAAAGRSGAASGASMAASQASGFAAGTRRRSGRYTSAMRNVMQGAGRTAGASAAASAAGGMAGGMGGQMRRRQGRFNRIGGLAGKGVGLAAGAAFVYAFLPEIKRGLTALKNEFGRAWNEAKRTLGNWPHGDPQQEAEKRFARRLRGYDKPGGLRIDPNYRGPRNAHGGMVRGHATGGLVQIGDPNASGGDTVATQIVTGAGEQAAVFTRHQRAVADEALAPMGGLSGLFGGVSQAHSASGPGSGRRFARGGLVGLPGGGKVHRSIRSDVSTLMRRYKLRATDAEDPGGLEVDFEPAPGGSWELLERLAKHLEPRQGSPRSPLNFVGFEGDSGYGRGRGMAVGWEERSGGGSGRLGPLPPLEAPRAARAARTAVAPKNTAREAVRRTASQIRGGGGTRAPGTSSMPGFALDSRGMVHVSTVPGTEESGLVAKRDRLLGEGKGSIKRAPSWRGDPKKAPRGSKPRLRTSLKRVRNRLDAIINKKARIIPEEEDFASLPQVGAYNLLETQLKNLASEYGLAERTHNLTDEEFLVTPRPSDPNSEEEVNQSGMDVEGRGFVRGIAQRVSELDDLIGRKGSMGEMIGSQSGAAGEVVGELDRRRTQTVGQMAVLKDQAITSARQIETYIKGKEGVESDLRRRGHSPAEKTKLRGYLRGWDQKLAPWYRDQVTLTGFQRPTEALLRTFDPALSLWNKEDSKLGKGSTRIKDIFAERSNWAGDGSTAGSRNVARELGFEREALSLDVGELQKERADVQGTRAPARTGGGGAAGDDGGMADLMREQIAALQASQRVSAAQFDVFKGFEPTMRAAFAKGGFVGRFDHGAASVERTGLAVVHRNEEITPDPKGAYGSQLAMNRAAAPPQVTLVVEGDVGPLISGVRAYVDGKVAQVSADTGRKGRQLAAAPGRY